MNLFKHQSQALVRAREGNLALFHDCGTGKTLTALHIIQHWLAKEGLPALVVCPLSIIEAAWIEDCEKFTPWLDITSLWVKTGPKASQERQRRLNENHDIYIANYDTFKSLYNDICKRQWGCLIVDESSKMKNPKSQITQALLSLAGIQYRGSKYKTDVTIPHRYVLSGTPAPNDQSEYWAQVKLVTGPGRQCFHDNYYVFRSRYFQTIDFGLTGQKMFKFQSIMQDEFNEAMKPVCHVVSKEDALDLPEQLHIKRYVQLGNAERQAYEKMKRDMVLRFGNEVVLSKTALTEVMKLRQLTSGFVYGNDGNIHRIGGQSKLCELKDLLDEIGKHQVIIWANFRSEIQDLLFELQKQDKDGNEVGAMALWADTRNRDAVIRGFQQNKFQYLIANPASAAHGLTFTNCRYAVYFSLNYSYELQKQSENRIHRIGQDRGTTYYYLIADSTIDSIIYRAVRFKEDLSNSILISLKKGTKKERAIA